MTEETCIAEEVFLRLYLNNRPRLFEFILVGGGIERGFIAEHRFTPGGSPRRSWVYLCKTLPYLGDVRTDPEVRAIRISRIQGVRLVPDP